MVIYALVAVGGTPGAQAAEIAEFEVGGNPSQAVQELAPGANGAMFFSQQWEGTGSSNPSIDRMRIGKLDAAGQVVASSTLPGNAGWSSFAPTSDGGAWLLHRKLSHVDASGTVTEVASVAAIGVHVARVATGAGDSAWLVGCGADECKAVRVGRDGSVTRYVLPTFVRPGSGSYGYGDLQVIPVEGGAWFGRVVSGGLAQAAFVSDGGAAVGVSVPAAAELVGAAGGSDVWWQQHAERRMGRVSTAGVTSDVRELGGSSEHTQTSDVGGGKVVWAQDAPFGVDNDGRVGVVGPGTNHAFDVPRGATTVWHDSAFGSGSCAFGAWDRALAPDGALWVVSTGHPDRINRQAMSGEFTNFIAPSAVSDREMRIWDIAKSSTEQLWFAIDTVAGPRVGRADPWDPPRGLPRSGGRTSPVPTEDPSPSGETSRNPRLKLSLDRLRRGGLRMRAAVARGARGRITVKVRSGRRTTVRRSGRSPQLAMTVKRKGRVRVRVSFAGRDGWKSQALRERRLRIR